ncbi:MAG: NADH-quinone oxidoreductase subunit NuoE [Nitrospirae bacterium]|nr:NADH-quinone oxidoreductase subunit NuoE [Nitrospirota bacterium]
MEKAIQEIFKYYRGNKSELIPILQEVQESLGYLPEKVMHDIAKFIGVAESHVYAVASFYSQFRLLPLGRKRIAVCRGTACHIRGAPHILTTIETTIGLKEGETSDDLEYTLETVACFGCCALAPCLRINMDVYGEMTREKVKELFLPLNEGNKDE